MYDIVNKISVLNLPKEVYPNIPWNKISGLRNRIVHDYGSIQLDIIYNTVKYDLPILIVDLNEIIK